MLDHKHLLLDLEGQRQQRQRSRCSHAGPEHLLRRL
jgi:hypothetical protein